MAVLTVPANPETPADIERLIRGGVRDIRGAAMFLGRSRSEVWALVTSGAVWSYRLVKEGNTRGKRMIPLRELRRIVAAEAVDAAGVK